MNIPLPRLLDDQLRQRALLHPVRLSISLNLAPLSTAQMTLPSFDAAAHPGDYVELFTSMGSAGVFRVQKIERDHQGLRTVHLEHGLVSLADSLISSTGEEEGAPLDILGQLMSHQASPARWQLGRVEVPAGKLLTWKWDYSNVLESLLGLMQELPDYALAFDQRTTPWTLNIIACTDQAACECRLNRNLLSLKVTVDRTELCTRLYIPPPDPEDEDAEPQEPVILNADTQSTWGIVSRSLSGDPGLTQEELLAEGRHYLELHKEPLISVSMDARDMSATSGQSFDRFTLGRVCRVCLPAQKETIRQRIVSIAWPDVYRKPDQITITLANKTSTAGSILSGLIVDTTVLRKRVTKNWNTLQEQEYVLIQAKKNITLLSEEIDLIGKEITIQANDIITLRAGVEENEATIVLANGRIDANAKEISANADRINANAKIITANADAIALKADQASLDLANGRIDAQANEISLHANNVLTLEAGVAENKAAIALANGDIALMADDITANANAIALKADQASLDLANGRIDAQANEISLKADRIDLQGYVTANELAVESAKINKFFSGSAVAAKMIVTNLTAISFTFAGNACTWTSMEVVTDVSVNATGGIAVRDADGNIIGTAVTGIRCTQDKEMIYYITWGTGGD